MKKFLLIILITSFLFVSCSKNDEEQIQWNPTVNTTVWNEKIDTSMWFFVSSVNSWNWADFWGISWADQYCQTLAENAWFTNKKWYAYLSNSPTDSTSAINARDRIWSGPWYNAKWDLIAVNVNDLHTNNNINKQTALNERGESIMGRWDEVNSHDILTGSTPDWMFSWVWSDTTCNNWTSSLDGAAIVGHHDKMWLDDSVEAQSWNSSHSSRWCSLENLKSTWWAWLIYCFAWDNK